MKKDEKKKHPRGSGRSVVRDWQPLFTQLQESIEWALDIAVKLARDYTEEIEAIERVRGYLRSWLAGHRVDVDVSDVLTTFSILFAAIEVDLGIDSSPMLTPLRSFPGAMHLPGSRDESTTVVIRRFPRRRNSACGAFTHLAA